MRRSCNAVKNLVVLEVESKNKLTHSRAVKTNRGGASDNVGGGLMPLQQLDSQPPISKQPSLPR